MLHLLYPGEVHCCIDYREAFDGVNPFSFGYALQLPVAYPHSGVLRSPLFVQKRFHVLSLLRQETIS